MDTSTGLIAVITDNGSASPAALRASVAFCRACPEIVRAIVATTRAEEIRDDAAPAVVFEAVDSEVAERPSVALLSRVADWSETDNGEKVRLIVSLDPAVLPTDPLVIYEVLQRLITNGLADGIIGIKRNITARGWKQQGEWVEPVEGGAPLEEDPAIYAFTRAFVDDELRDWRAGGRFLPYELLPIHR